MQKLAVIKFFRQLIPFNGYRVSYNEQMFHNSIFVLHGKAENITVYISLHKWIPIAVMTSFQVNTNPAAEYRCIDGQF